MHIYCEHAAGLHWRVFNGDDSVRLVAYREGALRVGEFHAFNHPNNAFQLDASSNGAFVTTAGALFQNNSTFAWTADEAFISFAGLSIGERHEAFTPTQAILVLRAVERIMLHIPQCKEISAGTLQRLLNKLGGGISIAQRPLGGPFAEAKIGGTTIDIDSTKTWTSTREPLLAATLAHEFIHLIGDNHDPATYASSEFHAFERCFIDGDTGDLPLDREWVFVKSYAADLYLNHDASSRTLSLSAQNYDPRSGAYDGELWRLTDAGNGRFFIVGHVSNLYLNHEVATQRLELTDQKYDPSTGAYDGTLWERIHTHHGTMIKSPFAELYLNHRIADRYLGLADQKYNPQTGAYDGTLWKLA